MTISANNSRKVLLYIVYGEDQIYYDGAIFSFLTFKYWQSENNIEFVVMTEMPEKFSTYPFTVIKMSEAQKNDWSLDGKYHFRIKNRGLAFVMDRLQLEESDRILFLDTDTYFKKSPLQLFDLIQFDQALLYLNEGLIYKRKRFSIYVENLEGISITAGKVDYKLSKKSALWGSLMIGLMGNMRQSLDWADELMLQLFDLVPAHTIEEFSLSEILLQQFKLIEGKHFIRLYSTSRKKEYARNILSNFFKDNSSLPLNDQVKLAQTVKIKRSLFMVLKQRFLRLFSN